MGSDPVSARILKKQNYAALKEATIKTVAIVKEVRSPFMEF